MKTIVGMLGLSLLLIPCCATAGTIWYVDGAVSASGTGDSWERAFKTIQEGIDAASDGERVLVAEGTYVENILFNGKNITLTSTDPLDPNVIAKTGIAGKAGGSVVTFSRTESEECVLFGFTVRNGSSAAGGGICGGEWFQGTHAAIRYNTITRNSAQFGGGIAFCNGIIEHNTISQNSATGNSAAGGGLCRCDGIIENNIITGNSARGEQSGGGGVAYCDAVIRNNVASANSATGSDTMGGGGLAWCYTIVEHNTIRNNSTDGYGGGLYNCDCNVENNAISENSASAWGGGLYGCSKLIRDNAIVGNSALYGGGLASCFGTTHSNRISDNSATAGGGVLLCSLVQNSIICGNSGGDVGGRLYRCTTVQNNVISANTAIWGAGLALCDGLIQNNTIVANSALWYGGGLGECQATIENCIIWENEPGGSGGEIYQSSTPSYCCIQDWDGGGNRNISGDPQFLDPDGQDDDPATHDDNVYSLLPTSPCIDAGNNKSPDLPESDLLGNPRILYGGRKKTAVVDIEAIEYYVNEIRADTDGQLTLTWSSLEGRTYAVQFSTDMMTWNLADGNVPSAGNQTTLWIDDGSKTGVTPLLVPRRFYRILENP